MSDSINDTRRHPLQQNAPSQAAPPTREEQFPAVILCRDCQHWDRRWPQANHAQCLDAMKYASQPLMTTDMQTCSHATPKVIGRH
jgi:hypothetical protein